MKQRNVEMPAWVLPNCRHRAGRLTNRSSGRVRDQVPSSYRGVRAAQLNR
jgi:hypothetical protein